MTDDDLPGLPARLGWRNPEDDGLSLRLYAADVPNPRWWRGSPAGRTIEMALSGHREGAEFRVLTEDELRAYLDRNVAEVLRTAAGWVDSQRHSSGDEEDEAYEFVAAELRAMAAARDCR